MVLAPEHVDSPIASFYAFASAPTVVDVPLHRCRGLWFSAFSCDVASDHPFIRTMLAVESGELSSYAGSPLEAYYDRFRPASAAETLGLDAGAGPLAEMPALAAVAPWWPVQDLAAFATRFAAGVERANSAKGRPLPATAGCHLYGPVSVEKGELEFARCVGVYRAVRTFGFQRSSETRDGDARGQVLVREGGAYAVVVLSGQHRVAAAAAAAGLASVPVRFSHGATTGSRVVYRSDVEHWPSVRRGWFSVPEALQVFDRLFAGVPAWTPPPTVEHDSATHRPFL